MLNTHTLLLNILVVGYGSIGKRHIENLSKIKNIKIIVCTSRQKDTFLEQKDCRVFKKLQQCIDENPHAAIISNVTSKHIKVATLLANHKIHLFIEKPLSDSLNKITPLITRIKKFNLITMMGCPLRFHPCIKFTKEYINSKKLGKIMSIQCENGSFLPDWHEDKDYRKRYSAKKKLGGGVVLTCIHEIDYLYWFFGNPKMTSSMIRRVSDFNLDVEDIASILFEFKNNIIGELHLDYLQKYSVRKCKIIGTKGILELDLIKNCCKIFDVNQKVWQNKLNLEQYEMNSMYVDELKYFINCVRSNRKAKNNINEGLKVLKIALNVKKSSQTKKVIIQK